MEKVEIIIIGAGAVGLAIANELAHRGIRDILVLERNDGFGKETSSRNSEVIHAGIYYPVGSLKATLCIQGNRLLYEALDRYGVLYQRIGKLVVATTEAEEDVIEEIFENARACGVKHLARLTHDEIREHEPEIAARTAFFSPDTGIFNTHRFMKYVYDDAKSAGVTFSFLTEVCGIAYRDSSYVVTARDTTGEKVDLTSRVVINATGLSAHMVAAMVGIDINAAGYALHYCRGRYMRLASRDQLQLSHLIYPPPTKISLGIHVTPDVSGGIRFGPDADYVDTIDYAIDESIREPFYESLRHLLPSLEPQMLIPDTVGIRPKLQGPEDTVRDFVITDEAGRGYPSFINLIGIESPGLTASPAIAQYVANMLLNR